MTLRECNPSGSSNISRVIKDDLIYKGIIFKGVDVREYSSNALVLVATGVLLESRGQALDRGNLEGNCDLWER